MNSYYHGVSSAKKWGGEPEDYMRIHEFIDSSKLSIGDFRHRAMYHHTQGVWLCQELFGRTIETTAGRMVPVRLIAEQHIIEDLGWLPSPADYLKNIDKQHTWMSGKLRKTVSLSTLGVKDA